MDVDEVPFAAGCSHLSAMLMSESTKNAMLDKLKTATVWNYRRMEGTTNPAKRRKVGIDYLKHDRG